MELKENSYLWFSVKIKKSILNIDIQCHRINICIPKGKNKRIETNGAKARLKPTRPTLEHRTPTQNSGQRCTVQRAWVASSLRHCWILLLSWSLLGWLFLQSAAFLSWSTFWFIQILGSSLLFQIHSHNFTHYPFRVHWLASQAFFWNVGGSLSDSIYSYILHVYKIRTR